MILFGKARRLFLRYTAAIVAVILFASAAGPARASQDQSDEIRQFFARRPHLHAYYVQLHPSEAAAVRQLIQDNPAVDDAALRIAPGASARFLEDLKHTAMAHMSYVRGGVGSFGAGAAAVINTSLLVVGNVVAGLAASGPLAAPTLAYSIGTGLAAFAHASFFPMVVVGVAAGVGYAMYRRHKRTEARESDRQAVEAFVRQAGEATAPIAPERSGTRAAGPTEKQGDPFHDVNPR